MKPGDLVEFKAGLFGVAPPKNLAIYVERVRRKGNFFVVLFTVKGRQEVKPENVTGRKFGGVRLEPPFEDQLLRDRLDQFVKEFASDGKKEKRELAPGEMNDRVLWNKVWDAGAQSPEDMAARFFRETPPKRSQVEQVRNALAACARPGVGYFDRLPGRGELWQPLTLDEYKRVLREIEGLNKLRKKLVKVVEEEDPDTGWIETRYVGVRAPDASLDDEDRERLRLVERAMASFVHHDRDTGDVGLAGTRVHTIDGFNFFGWLRWLALDWTAATRASLSSAFVSFLMENGVWSIPEAIVRIAKRKVAKHPGFSWDADPAIERFADRFAEATVAAEAPRRRDLRHLRTWTIDPADARDHDDAISFTIEPDGSRTLWVHIADVSFYVEKDGPLDRHARERATSVYLPTGVLPMLPHRLSDDLCSLNEGVDRLALTAALTYDATGEIAREEFIESVIRVEGNVSYEQVLAAIEAGDDANGFVALEAFAREQDLRRRGLVLETVERRVRVSPGIARALEDVAHGEARRGAESVRYERKSGNRATKMIEVFMVAANEAVARFLTARGVPHPYRCHPLPDRVGVERFNAQMATMELPFEIELPEAAPPTGASAEGGDDAPAGAAGAGPSLLDQLKKGGKLNLFGGGAFAFESDEPAPAAAEDPAHAAAAGAPTGAVLMKGLAQLAPEEQDAWLAPFRAVLDAVRSMPDERRRDVVYAKALSCMGRAVYTPANIGHFGLGSTCYCHFTSPIRRYADLVTHRQLRAVLRGEEPPHGADLTDVSNHCSEMSVAADALERENVDTAMVFISLNGEWDGPQGGVVNGITKGGVFLSLPRGLEARLATADLPGGPWSVDESESMLFAGSAERTEMQEEVTAANWRDLYNPDRDEVVRVRVRLADEIRVTIADRDFVDGRVSARLAPTE